MFDDNLVLCDGSADWSYANLVTSDYGSPVSTTRNDGGLVVLDMGQEGPYGGLDIALMFTEAANAAGDELTCIVEECDDYDFSSSQPHELAKFDIAAATKGVILGSEALAGVKVTRRVYITRRYVRIDASCTTSDDFGLVKCNATPFFGTKWG